MKKLLPALLLTLCLLPLTTAIGVSPPTGTIEFVPGASGEFDVRLSNSLDREIDTEVEISGNLAQYFEATNPRIGARSSTAATISYNLPDDITPGPNYQYITWTEHYFDAQQGGVAARSAIQAKFSVWKPYPGRYAELRINPRHVPQGEETDIKITIDSLGDQPVTGDVVIKLRAPDGTLQDTLYLRDVEVAGDDEFSRYVRVHSERYDPGKYEVDARFDYNSAVADAQGTLIIGTKSVDVLNVTRTFYKDKDVNRFEVEVESLWNEPLEVVSASMQLGASTGRTPAITLPPFSTKTLTGYWDTDTELAEGERPARVTASFSGGQPVERLFQVNVYNETPQPQVEEPRTVTLGMTDIAFLLIALLFVGYFLVHVLRRHA